jgi:hypothetical protein
MPCAGKDMDIQGQNLYIAQLENLQPQAPTQCECENDFLARPTGKCCVPSEQTIFFALLLPFPIAYGPSPRNDAGMTL